MGIDKIKGRYRKYGALWPTDNPVLIEIACIKEGGKWIDKKTGTECGEGLFQHYKNLQTLLWPEEYHNRWTDLILKTILEGTITCLTGPKDCSKTHSGLVKFGLTDYFCFPQETLIIVSSTTLAALEGRVWGDMKGMFQRAKQRFPFLSGNIIDSKHAISTDNLEDDAVIARDMRKGIICVPCKNSAGAFTGIASYVGMKQKRRRHLGDEMQFMAPGMMDSIANMNSGDYKGVFAGNQIGQGDPLDVMSEPEAGWESFPEPTKTMVWKNKRFLDSYTICLFGPDSPNFDDPEQPNKYPGLINKDSIDRVIAGYGKDSHQYYSQCLGVRKSGLTARRVITKELCRQFKAFDEIIWQDEKTTKIMAIDAAYGGVGGDRCIGGHIEFGLTVDGLIGLKVTPPINVPVSAKNTQSPEDQISTWAKNYAAVNGIQPENFFYDSTGRGSLGPSLARIWSVNINPVEFGGAATDRPVSKDIFIYDPKTKTKRLKTCKEHYSKFVTELWWTARLIIESGQMRGLPMDVCEEGCAREWKEVSGGRIEIETKKEMKERTGYSPDKFDWLVTALEGARRKGFQIARLGEKKDEESSHELFDYYRSKSKELNKRNRLNIVSA